MEHECDDDDPCLGRHLGQADKDRRRDEAQQILPRGEAISAYVERELAIIEGIQRGLGDVAAGRVVPHEQAMAEARQIIAEARRKKAQG